MHESRSFVTATVNALAKQFEEGQLSRRELIGALAALVASSAAAQAQGPLGAVRQVNHVSVFVPDVTKSSKFYQDLFGLPVLTRQKPG